MYQREFALPNWFFTFLTSQVLIAGLRTWSGQASPISRLRTLSPSIYQLIRPLQPLCRSPGSSQCTPYCALDTWLESGEISKGHFLYMKFEGILNMFMQHSIPFFRFRLMLLRWLWRWLTWSRRPRPRTTHQVSMSPEELIHQKRPKKWQRQIRRLKKQLREKQSKQGSPQGLPTQLARRWWLHGRTPPRPPGSDSPS